MSDLRIPSDMDSNDRPPEREAATPAARLRAWTEHYPKFTHSGDVVAEYRGFGQETELRCSDVAAVLAEVDRLLGWGSRAALCLEGYEKALRGLGPGYRGAADYVLDLRSEWEAADNRHLDTHRGELGDDR